MSNRSPIRVRLAIRPEVSQDIRDLPNAAVRLEALLEIKEIATHPFRSARLGTRSYTGNLSDCRKKYFHGTAYRVVFRLLPDEKNPNVADVIVVGPRLRSVVYDVAAQRLGR